MKTNRFLRGLAILGVLAGGPLLASLGCTKKTTETTIVTTGATTTTPTSTALAPGQDLPGIVIDILSVGGGSGAGGNVRPGDTVSVTFTLKKNDGANLSPSELDSSTAMIDGPSFNYQKVVDETEDWHKSVSQNADGSWTFSFPSAIPAAYLPPDNAGPTADVDDLRGQALLDGTYTVGLEAVKNYFENATVFTDAGNATKDFLFGGASTLTPREVVKTENCNQCHVTLRFHEGRRRDTKMCVLCHTAGANDLTTPTGVPIEFKVMIHKIHNGEHLPSVLGVTTDGFGARDYTAAPVPYVLTGDAGATDFSEVGFPVWPSLSHPMPKNAGYSLLSTTNKTTNDAIRQGVVACVMCHGAPLAGGTAPAQGDLAFAQPSRRACGSCHDDVVWTNPYVQNSQTMPAQADDSGCAGCHPTTGSAIAAQDAHVHPLDNSAIDPGVSFIATNLSGGGGSGGAFQVGDSPTLTFTIKDEAGTDIAPTNLDSASALVVGPTTNRQNVMPYPGSSSNAANPFDFSGRLASGTTTGKGSMSRTVGATKDQVLFVDLTSPTAFNVTGFVAGGPNDALGSGTLPGSPSTNPSGSSLGNVVLTSAVARQLRVVFSDATNFDVLEVPAGTSIGSGQLPAATNTSTRFISTDTTVAFTITVGSAAFANGNAIYMDVFTGAAANPVTFAIVVGRTAFAAGDRFYSEAIAPAASYTMKIPMDITLEFLGNGNGAIGQTLTAAHTPVYFGRQTVLEQTAPGASTNLSTAAARFDRFVTVDSTAGFAATNFVVLEPGAAVGTREYLQIGLVEGAPLNRLWFATPLRYGHAGLATVQLATLTFRQEGANYTLDPAAGQITSVVAFGNGNGVVMSYRTDGTFGYRRHIGDAVQTVYQPPLNDSPGLGQDWGEWTGLSFLDGTYTAGIWGYRNVDLPLNGEVQTYRSTSVPSLKDFLFGATATTIVPHAIIASGENCNACHKDVMFHGGGRRSFDSCSLCHSMSGSEDRPRYVANGAPATAGVTIDFRTMLHKIHRGKDLANASTYTVVGFGSPPANFTPHTYEHIVFPAMPGKTRHCTKCHGTSNAWQQPSVRTHPDQTVSTRRWRSVCSACHDSTDAAAHIELNTTASGLESCEACHGVGHSENVALLHHNR